MPHPVSFLIQVISSILRLSIDISLYQNFFGKELKTFKKTGKRSNIYGVPCMFSIKRSVCDQRAKKYTVLFRQEFKNSMAASGAKPTKLTNTTKKIFNYKARGQKLLYLT